MLYFSPGNISGKLFHSFVCLLGFKVVTFMQFICTSDFHFFQEMTIQLLRSNSDKTMSTGFESPPAPSTEVPS